MMPGVQFCLSVEKSGVYVRFLKVGNKNETKMKIKSVQHFVSFIQEKAKIACCEPKDLIIMCSSSMDSPEVYTKNSKVIALAHAIR